MEQCWNANPAERPNIVYLWDEINEIRKLYYQNENNEQQIYDICATNNYTDSGSINSLVRKVSKFHIFENLPEPKNATEEEQEAYHSMQQNLSIPSEIEDIISEQTEHQIEPNNSTAINKEVKGKSKRINFNDDDKDNVNHNIKSKKIKLSNNKEFQYIQYIQKSYIANDDVEDDEITNNANLHSEDQENLEIPEDGF
ncbi:unnamed protein product [Rhizophagus irregularis]|nr:unnamed protein product [Rhizophagus irregularis]